MRTIAKFRQFTYEYVALMKKRWQITLGFLLSVMALAVILKGIHWEELGRAMVQANYRWLLPFVVLETLSLWARGMRWRVLLEEKIGGSRLFWLTNISYYLSNILPLRIGEVARVYLATRGSDVSGMQALSTAVLERMIDVVTVFALLLVVVPLVPEAGPVVGAGYLVVTGVLLLMLSGLWVARKRRGFLVVVELVVGRLAPRIRDKTVRGAESFLRSIDIVNGRRLTMAFLWSLLVWLLATLAAYCMLLAFLPDQPLYVAIFVTAIIAFGIALPSVPAGVGLWEAATVAGLAVFGVGRETALAYGVTMHLAIFVQMTILGMVGLQLEGENLNHLARDARRFMRGLRKQGTTVA